MSKQKKHKQCTVKRIEYVPSEQKEVQGKWQSIQKYLKQDFYVKEDRNGYWLLIKASKVIVTISSPAGVENLNMKGHILDFYKKQRLTDKRVEQFTQEIRDEKIAIFLDSDDNSYLIKKTSTSIAT
ncbi:hypothetical protein [Paenibacillus sp. FSL H7-689]|uniref:hypothetical protein n=1 Tax=Paenibacillus sp. FSL H7-689 TaxID=1227349 RepID=UPI0003E2B477|nr:hypothetical protein [Paenibacillus sp. FSL H7-689]ETT51582.1 hypothetical protein C170_14355 [Paenibacillus sp. FSL H7-689]